MQTGENKTLHCDDIVIAFGTKAVNGLQELLEDKFDDVVVIGDAKTPDTITSSIHDGFFAALEI
jgi:2-enoate reductase